MLDLGQADSQADLSLNRQKTWRTRKFLGSAFLTGYASKRRSGGDDEELKQMIAAETINAEVARLIYEARKTAGLTQVELAELIGSKQPVIARLEDADCEGHSLTMLQRIAIVLNQRIEINFVPVEEQQEAV